MIDSQGQNRAIHCTPCGWVPRKHRNLVVSLKAWILSTNYPRPTALRSGYRSSLRIGAPGISRSLANVLARGTMMAKPTNSNAEIKTSLCGASQSMSKRVPKARMLPQRRIARRSRRKNTRSKRAAAASASLGSPHSGQRTPDGLGCPQSGHGISVLNLDSKKTTLPL